MVDDLRTKTWISSFRFQSSVIVEWYHSGFTDLPDNLVVLHGDGSYDRKLMRCAELSTGARDLVIERLINY